MDMAPPCNITFENHRFFAGGSKAEELAIAALEKVGYGAISQPEKSSRTGAALWLTSIHKLLNRCAVSLKICSLGLGLFLPVWTFNRFEFAHGEVQGLQKVTAQERDARCRS